MLLYRIRIVICILSVIGVFGCQTSKNVPLKISNVLAPRVDIEQYQLENGMRIILHKGQSERLEMRLLVHAGSLQESDSERGIAHFVEHMAFKGTKNFPQKSMIHALQQQGGTLGVHINAVTHYDSTIYNLSFANASVKSLSLGLNILADWSHQLNFDSDAFEHERAIIIEEWRLSQSVGGLINKRLENFRYQGSRFLNRNVIGSLDAIRNVARENAIAYYKKWYQPQRMTLIVSGKFDALQVHQEIDKLFSGLKRGATSADPQRWQKFSSSKKFQSALIFEKENSQRLIQLTLQQDLLFESNTKQGLHAEMLDSVWLHILAQRLAILVDKGLLKGVYVGQKGHLLSPYRKQILLTVLPFSNDYLSAFERVSIELERLSQQKVSAQELLNAKRALLANARQKMSHIGSDTDVVSQLLQASRYQLAMLDNKQQFKILDVFLKTLSRDNIQQAVQHILKSSLHKVALVGPGTDTGTITSATLSHAWGKIRLSRLAPFNLTATKLTLKVNALGAGEITNTKEVHLKQGVNSFEYQLSNGINVMLFSDPKLQGGSQINVQFKGGASLEPDPQIGVISWASRMGERCGYGEYSASQLARWSKKHNVSVTPYVGFITHGFHVNAPLGPMQDALKLLHLKLTQPKFCEQKLQNMQKGMLQSLKQSSVERKFKDLVSASAFTHSERLSVNKLGAWRNFSVKQLAQWQDKVFSDTQQMRVTIVSSQSIANVKKQIERWLASLPQKARPLMQVLQRNVQPKLGTESKRFYMSSSNKAMVEIQYSRKVTWSIAMQVKTSLLEQIMNKRLQSALRDKVSGTYAISMSQMLVRDPSAYYLGRMYFSCDPTRSDALAEMANRVVEKMRDKGVSEQEMQQAKKTWVIDQSQRERYSQYWVEALSQDAFRRLPYQNIREQRNILQKVQVSDLNILAKALLGQNKKTYVLMPTKD